ncbi:hypothetical protein DFH06DRAFT_978036 [Mycena polygramma]|nr:hypothetical protein DFH06DRAFT_971123 [Mycena polygramma]KAJ7983275.1 hypothetical protein DFH06DRAFT_978036 [Mycena polygramma]
MVSSPRLQQGGIILTWDVNAALYQNFAPRIYEHVDQTKYRILNRDWTLRDNFPPGAFHASEWFLGSDESPPRLDDLQMLWSWRALTALGNYNARWGGEVILWEEKKVIKFPVGSTFLFPSAFMRYSFTQVNAGEHQFWFSQYSQAGLFRHVENGHRCEANFDTQSWTKTRRDRDAMKDKRMETALGMFSTVDE